MTSLSCPYCGSGFVQTPEGLYCQLGDMFVSSDLEEQLKAYQQSGGIAPQVSNLVGSRKLYCPKCGHLARNEGGHVFCSHCNATMNPFLFSLIKAHPHQ